MITIYRDNVPEAHNRVPFICQVCFIPNEHDDDITSSLRSDVIDPL